MTKLERDLLNMVQNEFPLEPRPFAAIAVKLGISQKRCIAALGRLKKSGILRDIRPVVEWRSLGFKTVLVGMSVAPHKSDAVARILNRIEGVTHNYLREGSLNLWFTLIYDAPAEKNRLFARLRKIDGVHALYEFKAEKVYKIGLVLDV